MSFMGRPLRVGINALFLLPGGIGGGEVYLRNVLRGIAEVDDFNEYFIYRNRETEFGFVPDQKNFHDRATQLPATFRPARILYEQTVLPLLGALDRLDAWYNPGSISPILAPAPSVTVIHDLQYARHPEYFRWFDLPFWKLLMPLSARRSKILVVDSSATEADVRTFYPWKHASQVIEIPLGVEPQFIKIAEDRALRERPSERYLLTASTSHPHKNFDNLLKAFAIFRETEPGYKLIVLGMKGFDAVRITELRKLLRLEESVVFTGWTDRATVYKYFLEADAFVFASKFEGFGLPLLEALTAGLPTACSRISPLTDLAGDAVRYFDPSDERDICEALLEICNDGSLRERCVSRGRSVAGEYSCARSSTRLVEQFVRAGTDDPMTQPLDTA